MKHLLFRALGIGTIKNVLYIIMMVAASLFIQAFYLDEMSWQASRAVRRRLALIALVIVLTFLWDAVVAISFYSWLYSINLFAHQGLVQNILYFAIHAGAMTGAYSLRRRLAAAQGLAEGLES